MTGLIAQVSLNNRIHRNTTGPPKDASGKPAPVRTDSSGRATSRVAGKMWFGGG